jgi:hypothetical protein
MSNLPMTAPRVTITRPITFAELSALLGFDHPVRCALALKDKGFRVRSFGIVPRTVLEPLFADTLVTTLARRRFTAEEIAQFN